MKSSRNYCSLHSFPVSAVWNQITPANITYPFDRHPKLNSLPEIPPSRYAGVARPPKNRISVFNFDWDDNIFYMPTTIQIFHKKTKAEVAVTTKEFAIERTRIGKLGKYVDYEVIDKSDGSFRYFSDPNDGSRNYFLEHVQRQVEEKDARQWQGPSWRAFCYAMQSQNRANVTNIITARVHAPETILSGLEWLKRQGFIAFTPPWYNIFPVAFPPLSEALGEAEAVSIHPSEAKVKVMRYLLNSLKEVPVDKNCTKVTRPDGQGEGPYHLWGFSDDDLHNVERAHQALAVNSGEYCKSIKISLFYTGEKHGGPRAEVLQPNGTLRPAANHEAVFANLADRRE